MEEHNGRENVNEQAECASDTVVSVVFQWYFIAGKNLRFSAFLLVVGKKSTVIHVNSIAGQSIVIQRHSPLSAVLEEKSSVIHRLLTFGKKSLLELSTVFQRYWQYWKKVTVVHDLLPMLEENQKFSTVITIAEENPPSFTVLKHCWKKIDRFSPLLALLQQNPALVALQEKNPSLRTVYWHFWKKNRNLFIVINITGKKITTKQLSPFSFFIAIFPVPCAPPYNNFHPFFQLWWTMEVAKETIGYGGKAWEISCIDEEWKPPFFKNGRGWKKEIFTKKIKSE